MAWRVTGGQLKVLFCLLVFAVSEPGVASEHIDDNGMPLGVAIVEAEDVIRLAQQNRDLIIIDSRTSVDREIGYIEESVSLSDNQTNCETLSKISKRLDRPLVFYCNGIKCARSQRAVRQASVCGYSKLYWFKGGYEEWREKHLPVLGPVR